jgi:putative transcriptional regulator
MAKAVIYLSTPEVVDRWVSLCSPRPTILKSLVTGKEQESWAFAEDLIESLQQAAEHAAGKKVRALRVSEVKLPDVKAIRVSLRMSQHHFAAAYRIPLPTLKNWEQGRRMPDAPAAAYLLAIKRRPKEVMEAVARPTQPARPFSPPEAARSDERKPSDKGSPRRTHR